MQVGEESGQRFIVAITQVAASIETFRLPHQPLCHIVRTPRLGRIHGERYLGGGPAHIQGTNQSLKQKKEITVTVGFKDPTFQQIRKGLESKLELYSEMLVVALSN